MTDTATGDQPTTHRAAPPVAVPAGHIGRTVTASMLSGLLLAFALVVGPFAGAEEHVVSGTVLLSFAAAWAALARCRSVGRTNHSVGRTRRRPR